MLDGVPRFPENTMPAFRNAAKREQAVLELDVKLTKDRVPVVIHDDTFDRTTDCSGPVKKRTLDQLRGCRADVLGSPDSGLPTKRVRDPDVRVPRLSTVLRFAKRTGARVNVEIKNLPTDNDFDVTSGYANRVMDTVIAARLPKSQLLVQSFLPQNLDVAKDRLPGVETSLLTLRAFNSGGPATAQARGYEYVSPGFPVDQTYVSQAHDRGRRIVPYTLDTPRDVKKAARLGADEIITDDPAMARRALRSVEPAAPKMPPPPGDAACRRARASRTMPLVKALDREPDAPRVFAMQFKQDVRHVESYASFRTKIECMILDYVKPRLARDRPNVVAFNEDIGLLTIATGSRGRAARETFGGEGSPGCEGQPAPCGALGALVTATAGYSPQVAAYRSRFPGMSPVSQGFVAATDTFARGWMQTFSDMARRYDLYILGSNNQPLFRESRDPAEIRTFRDPDLPRPDSVYVATDDDVFNEVFMWGPKFVRPDGPRPLKNVVARNKKVPLTEIEEQLQLKNGPSKGPDAIENVDPYRLPGTRARISFATSLPAFVYGDPPPGTNPCSDTSKYYMRCLDKLGTNLVMQDEANPGRWAADAAQAWQPLEWMTSTWRAAADPEVDFDYNVTPHLVGNLADLPFDGQTAITQRGLDGGERCTYVGNREFLPEDPKHFTIGGERQRVRPYAGRKREFLALVPWVVSDRPRPELRDVARDLAPGSGAPIENDYLETAVAADLPFPVDADRSACAGMSRSGERDDSRPRRFPRRRG